MSDIDVIVVGSGPAGVHSALTLLEGGASVLMIDGGKDGPNMEDAPEESFSTVRRTKKDQWKWFLGKDLSGISLQGLSGGLGGGQISGNRTYVADVSSDELPLTVENGTVLQSLAKGGLCAGWGAACAILSADELTAMGLPAAEMQKYYERVAKRIGISGPQTHPWIQPALPLDAHAVSVSAHARKKSAVMTQNKWKAVQPHSAVLTNDIGDRKASTLADMEYWADPHRSVYRPQYTLETLQSMPHFTYAGNQIVRHIRSTVHGVEVFADTDDGATVLYKAKRCILVCNAVGTARILLESLNLPEVDVPFLAKPRFFSVCFNPKLLSKAGSEKRTSLCQYLVMDEEKRQDMPRACAQLYSYRSMLLFRLVGSIPLPAREAMQLANLLSPALVIADIRMPITLQQKATLRYDSSTLHGIKITFQELSPDEKAQRKTAWRSIKKALKTVGLLPVKNMTMPEGSTVHYAGTVPHAKPGDYPLTSDADGRSQELPNVSIADASTFRALSPLPHTLTIMANACRVAEAVLKNL